MVSLCATYMTLISGWACLNEVSGNQATGFDYSGAHQPNFDKNYYSFFNLTRYRERREHMKGFTRFQVLRCFVDRTFQSGRLCRRRYRRHKHGNNNKLNDLTNVKEEVGVKLYQPTKYRYGYRIDNAAGGVATLPHEDESCLVISNFLSNDTNLRFIREKSKELICASGELYRKFHTLKHLGNVDFKQSSHRARIMKKWKHLACQLYHKFIDCLKEVSSSDNHVPIPYDLGHNIDTSDGDNLEARIITNARRREAVHVSDSSHVDFLNFMIGCDTEWTDDDQMWFY